MHLTEDSYIHSNGILGLICAGVEDPEGVLDRVSHMTQEIQEKVAEEGLREKMLFLLNKASRSDSLSAAMEKTMVEYGMGKKEIEKLLKKFDKVDVNPITFKKDSKMKELPGVRKMLL